MYNQVCEPILPYSEEPPSSGPSVEMGAPGPTGADSTPRNESTMDHDITDDLYQ